MATLERLGLLKTSLIDFPGEVAAVVFTAGCNLRCPYCHNPRLVPGPPPEDFLTRDAVFDALASRAGVLTGVCVTGGEPLVHDGLADLLDAVRGLGLTVKMETNGRLPERLEAVSVDFVALDLKLAPERYGELGTGARLTLAQFRPGTTLDPRIASAPAPDEELIASCVEAAARHGVDCRVREATTM